jgi:hypothetical protein
MKRKVDALLGAGLGVAAHYVMHTPGFNVPCTAWCQQDAFPRCSLEPCYAPVLCWLTSCCWVASGAEEKAWEDVEPPHHPEELSGKGPRPLTATRHPRCSTSLW